MFLKRLGRVTHIPTSEKRTKHGSKHQNKFLLFLTVFDFEKKSKKRLKKQKKQGILHRLATLISRGVLKKYIHASEKVFLVLFGETKRGYTPNTAETAVQ